MCVQKSRNTCPFVNLKFVDYITRTTPADAETIVSHERKRENREDEKGKCVFRHRETLFPTDSFDNNNVRK